jgi:hypothetical protein
MNASVYQAVSGPLDTQLATNSQARNNRNVI